jgi:D-amino-acid dehydrogenase
VAHLTIIGGGIIGLCSAYYAAQRGHRITLIDRNPPQRDGCSFGNAGMVVPSHFIPLAAPGMVALGLKWMWNPESPFYIKPRLDADLLAWAFRFWRAATPDHVRRSAPLLRDLSLASRACFAALAASGGNDFGLVQQGLLMLCKSQHTLDEEAVTAAEARRLGLPAEVLDARATAALDPDVTMEIAGSVFFPQDCHLTPGRLMARLQQGLEQAGHRFLWSTEVTGWRRDGRRIRAVQTSQGELESDEFLLAGGSWSPGTGDGLGLRLPMQAGKGYSLTLTQPRQLPRLCSIFTEARVAVTPMGSSLRFGGTMEIAGLNEDINPVRVQGIIKSVPKYYPQFQPSDFAGIQPWRGLRPCSPDGLPYLGRSAAHTNLIVATGHAMMGLSLGPITGQLVAELASGQTPSIDLNLLSPDRYA